MGRIAALFRSLEGNWKLVRKVVNEATAEGFARFKKLETQPNTLAYRENGTITFKNGTSTPFYRKYIYQLENEKISVFFHEQSPRLMHTLQFREPCKDYPFRAEAIHFCNRDTYNATYEFQRPDQFELNYSIEGPYKNQLIQTVFQKQIGVLMTKSVAIIGAGPAGITSAKTALECDLNPTVFERASMIGGLWKPHSESISDSGSVWDNMQTNISRHTCQFSDFPWKPTARDFPYQNEVREYLCDYAKEFKVNDHIRFNSEVIKVEQSNNQWVVEWIDKGKKDSQLFDNIIVCSGIFSKAFIPLIPSLEKFKGEVRHSKDYKSSEPFKDKVVAVIGNAFSGCEIAADVAAKSKHVVNVVHRNMWVVPRYLYKSKESNKKIPLDLIFYSRSANARNEGVPPEELNTRKNRWLQELTQQGNTCPELQVKVDPSSPIFIAISDNYVTEMENKKIHIKKGDIETVEENALVFQDGSKEKVDSLIFCTGYRTELPFFNQKILDTLGYKPEDQLQPLLLYESVFHPSLPHLAFVGMYRGPFFATMELQARLACMGFSCKIEMPSEEEMKAGIENERLMREKIPRPQFTRGNYVGFSDDLARKIFVLPDFDTMKNEDPILYKKLWEGPFSAASYRLTGFGSKKELALKIIDEVNQAAND
jgi:dimethylaniline monooxygenase (N-oxide forming)